MAKRITEQIERWCCEDRDLSADALHPGGVLPEPAVYPVGSYHNPPRFKVCRHCGQRYEYYRFTDAAGSSDWGYREIA